MTDNNTTEETRQQELQHQQQALFSELSREQTEAETALKEEQERLDSQDVNDE